LSGRTAIIGLDGGTFDIIEPMIEQGRLRTIAAMMKTGSSGCLTSTILPLSATAWSSFATGKNPGKHGIYDFSRRVKETYRQQPTTRFDRRSRALWNYASDAGKKCVVINVPLTYPPEKINGVMISGFPYPERRRDFAYPKEILDEIERELGITSLHKPSPHFLKEGEERKLIEEMLATTQKQVEVINYLLRKKEDWDLFVTVFDATDVVSHFFWRYIDPKHPNYDAEKAKDFGPLFYDIYDSMDRAIGAIANNFSPSDHIFVISDHGFGPVYYAVYMNNWLMKNNYLRLKKNLGTGTRKLLFNFGITTDSLFRSAKALNLVGSRTFTYSTKSRKIELAKKVTLSLDDIDWDSTLVYSYGNYGQFFLNVEGREPNGKVKPGKQYEDLVLELISKLKELRDPKTGKVIFDRIYRKDQIYSGPYAVAAPDIVFLDSSMTYRAHRMFEFGNRNMIAPDPIYSASHRMEGILVASGADIVCKKSSANIIDLCPTILYLLGVPIPPDVDGRVLTDILSETGRNGSNISEVTSFERVRILKEVTTTKLIQSGERKI